MGQENKGGGKGKGEEKEPVVKLFAENDSSVENRVAYEMFALTTLCIDRATGAWFEHDGEYAMFLYTGAMEQAQKRIDCKGFMDFTPNEERLAYFRAYLSLWREREETLKRIEEITDELKALG